MLILDGVYTMEQNGPRFHRFGASDRRPSNVFSTASFGASSAGSPATASQVDHKALVVMEHLVRATKQQPATVEPLLEGPAFGYRRRARLAIDARVRNAVRVGFRGAKSTDVVDVGHCMVLDDLLAPLPRALQGLTASLEAPRNVGHVELAASESSDGTTVFVIGVRTVDDTSAADRTRWVEFARPHRAYLQFIGESSPAVQPCGERPGYLLPNFGLRLGFEPGDFLQGNAVVNRALIARLIEWLDPKSGQRVLDAFCGLGNFALPIAARGANVVGVEGRASTVSTARQNAIDNGIDTVEFMVRNLQ